MTKNILALALIASLFLSSCAIRYTSFSASPQSVSDSAVSVSVLKAAVSPRLLHKWKRKGLSYHHLRIYNPSDSVLTLDKNHFFAIGDMETKTVLDHIAVLRATKFNKGLFYGVTAWGAIYPMSYSSSGGLEYNGYSRYTGSAYLVAVPLFVYGAINSIWAMQSKKKFQTDVANYYLLGLQIPAHSYQEGFVLVKSTQALSFQVSTRH